MVRCGESTLIKGRWVSSRSARVYEHHFDVIESKLVGRIFAAKGCGKSGKVYRCGQAQIIIKVMCDGFLYRGH